ncbi:CD44 antigen-like [Astyanax mexicanus]|uniref:CD44 antigen n=1 Tax=Astyanax mexicanus TaxID=7994 RepID=A0A8T2KT02_ASTMX|nr:CD44 antigen-like [Astyanax mexicanus]
MQHVLLSLLSLSGLLTLQFTWGQEVPTSRSSYAGVVHLEGSGRYSLNYQQAKQLCQNLGYSLATEEQITEAYNHGLKTCRYGWIEGQKTSFLPDDAHPDCTLNSTGVTSHTEEENQLYDVYCFTHTAAQPEDEYDVLDEVIADGFIVDTKETSTTSVTKSTYSTTTTPNSLNLSTRSSLTPSLEETSITATITALPTDPEAAAGEPESNSSSSTSKNSGITEQDAPEEITTKQSVQNFLNMEAEGSGMSPEALYRIKTEDPSAPTSVNTPVLNLHSTTRLIWIPEAVDGSGMEPEGATSITPTSKVPPKPTTVVVEEPEVEEEIQVPDAANPETRAEAPGQHKGRINLPADIEPTTSALAEEGTPAWLIIFAFCMTLGAILCIFAGIATKDMWYGPSRRSLNVAGEVDESSKAATLPLSEKEQELVTLMNGGQKTDKDSAVISVDEAPEKEYLM